MGRVGSGEWAVGSVKWGESGVAKLFFISFQKVLPSIMSSCFTYLNFLVKLDMLHLIFIRPSSYLCIIKKDTQTQLIISTR